MVYEHFLAELLLLGTNGLFHVTEKDVIWSSS